MLTPEEREHLQILSHHINKNKKEIRQLRWYVAGCEKLGYYHEFFDDQLKDIIQTTSDMKDKYAKLLDKKYGRDY